MRDNSRRGVHRRCEHRYVRVRRWSAERANRARAGRLYRRGAKAVPWDGRNVSMVRLIVPRWVGDPSTRRTGPRARIRLDRMSTARSERAPGGRDAAVRPPSVIAEISSEGARLLTRGASLSGLVMYRYVMHNPRRGVIAFTLPRGPSRAHTARNIDYFSHLCNTAAANALLSSSVSCRSCDRGFPRARFPSLLGYSGFFLFAR